MSDTYFISLDATSGSPFPVRMAGGRISDIMTEAAASKCASEAAMLAEDAVPEEIDWSTGPACVHSVQAAGRFDDDDFLLEAAEYHYEVPRI